MKNKKPLKIRQLTSKEYMINYELTIYLMTMLACMSKKQAEAARKKIITILKKG